VVQVFGAGQKQVFKNYTDQNIYANPTIAFSSLSGLGITSHRPILLPKTSLTMAYSAPFMSTPRLTNIGLTFDHRLLSGAEAADILVRVDSAITDPTSFFGVE
jgi:pyruvate/2-oxoglutarate dehydrogenase complex dihydrolipoamide acyltransferase (E2) component